jgi:heptosyltransferase-2
LLLMKTLVIRFSSLGDCVLLCPFLEHLKRHGAEEVAVVTKRAYAELFASVRGVDRVIALDPSAGWRGARQIIDGHRSDDYLVIDAHNTLRSRIVARGLGGAESTIKKHYLERLGLIWFKRQAAIPPMSARYSALGELLGMPPMARTTGGIEIRTSLRKKVKELLRPLRRDYVAIAPGSRWPMKMWGEDRYMELVERIVEHYGCDVVLLGDRSDEAITRRIAARFSNNVVNLAGNTSIMEAAAAIEQSVTFIGNDSGLMHLSEAVGVPVVALFGPTVEAFGYYPSLPASQVIDKALSCRPCSRNGARPCPKGTQECLRAIGVDRVEAAFSRMLEEGLDAKRAGI